MTNDRAWIETELLRYGASSDSIIHFDGPLRPAHLPHLDLWPARGASPLVDAVVEMQQRPVLYVVRGPKSPREVEALTHLLAQRAAADHLGVIEPGVLTLYPVVQTTKKPRAARLKATAPEAPSQIPRLALALDDIKAAGAATRLHDDLVDQLKGSTGRIAATRRVGPADALSLVGRALFMRFLIDRGLVSRADLEAISPEAPSLVECMSTPRRAASAFAWLDATFNGNLLPLTGRGQEAFWEALGDAGKVVCFELSNILDRSGIGGQRSFEWATLNFCHIPVGLLSQVYEDHCHRHLPAQASAQSVHYTPRSLAEYVVSEVFLRLENAHEAKILDPAVGAGVFLVAAFRALIAARWRTDGKRPGTAAIRRILYDQLRGFDINDAALKLTALSLYLTALELDPDPRPLEGLKFDNLLGKVLVDVRVDGDDATAARGLPVLGSLGAHVDESHRGAYDIVLGNPPWTAWKRPRLPKATPSVRAASDAEFSRRTAEVAKVVRAIVERRLGKLDEAPFELVDLTPDVPFCWRALDWAKPDGQIALVVHARLLFKQSAAGLRTRGLLLRGARLNGILNGAALHETKVWPGVKAPFCLLFADNHAPAAFDAFTFASPLFDAALNRRGHIRIDASSAREISWEDAYATPTLLKTLFRGTDLDVAVVERLRKAKGIPLGTYWRSDLRLAHGQGYRLGGDESAPQDASHLADLPELTTRYAGPLLVSSQGLRDRFTHTHAAFPREREIYVAPLVMVKQSPGAERNNGRALLAWEDVAYSESFYGFSTAGHPSAELLARYLLLVMNSNLVLYWALMTSGKFGVERRVFHKADIEQFPLRPFETLSEADHEAISELSERLLRGDRPWDDIDAWLVRVYGLSRPDQVTIRDTLDVALPWEDAQKNAQRPPTAPQIKDFAARLCAQVGQLTSRSKLEVAVEVLRAVPFEPWAFVRVSAARSDSVDASASLDAQLPIGPAPDFIADADFQGATRMVYADKAARSLTIGILAQYRYWTPSKARLLALDLVRQHRQVLAGGASA